MYTEISHFLLLHAISQEILRFFCLSILWLQRPKSAASLRSPEGRPPPSSGLLRLLPFVSRPKGGGEETTRKRSIPNPYPQPRRRREETGGSRSASSLSLAGGPPPRSLTLAPPNAAPAEASPETSGGVSWRVDLWGEAVSSFVRSSNSNVGPMGARGPAEVRRWWNSRPTLPFFDRTAVPKNQCASNRFPVWEPKERLASLRSWGVRYSATAPSGDGARSAGHLLRRRKVPPTVAGGPPPLGGRPTSNRPCRSTPFASWSPKGEGRALASRGGGNRLLSPAAECADKFKTVVRPDEGGAPLQTSPADKGGTLGDDLLLDRVFPVPGRPLLPPASAGYRRRRSDLGAAALASGQVIVSPEVHPLWGGAALQRRRRRSTLRADKSADKSAPTGDEGGRRRSYTTLARSTALILRPKACHNTISNQQSQMRVSKPPAESQTSGEALFSIELTHLILTSCFFGTISNYVCSDFSIYNILTNSTADVPLFYKISATWSNHEGSLLLWCWLLSLNAFLFCISICNTQFKCFSSLVASFLFVAHNSAPPNVALRVTMSDLCPTGDVWSDFSGAVRNRSSPVTIYKPVPQRAFPFRVETSGVSWTYRDKGGTLGDDLLLDRFEPPVLPTLIPVTPPPAAGTGGLSLLTSGLVQTRHFRTERVLWDRWITKPPQKSLLPSRAEARPKGAEARPTGAGGAEPVRFGKRETSWSNKQNPPFGRAFGRPFENLWLWMTFFRCTNSLHFSPPASGLLRRRRSTPRRVASDERKQRLLLDRRSVSWQTSGLILIFFTFFILLTSNPFLRTSIPSINSLAELNPILQDPVLAIHPPCIYAGYVASAIAFSLCMSTFRLEQRTRAGYPRPMPTVMGPRVHPYRIGGRRYK